MSADPAFSTQLLGQTEKALNAFLLRLLAEPGLTESQWIALTLTRMSGERTEHTQLIGELGGALKVPEADAAEHIVALANKRLLIVTDREPCHVTLTDEGRQLHTRIRAEVDEITRRMWGDLPAEDLATAGRVLNTVLGRANAELERPSVALRAAGATQTRSSGRTRGPRRPL